MQNDDLPGASPKGAAPLASLAGGTRKLGRDAPASQTCVRCVPVLFTIAVSALTRLGAME